MRSASRWPDVSVDWHGVQSLLADQVVAAVEKIQRCSPGTTIDRVEVGGLHSRDMLVLWPTVTVIVTGDRHREVETPRVGDHVASRITAAGGLGGSTWIDVFDGYERSVRAACCEAEGRLQNTMPDNSVRCLFIDDVNPDATAAPDWGAATSDLIAVLRSCPHGDTAATAKLLAQRGHLTTVVAVLSESAPDERAEATILDVLTDHYAGSQRWCGLDYAPLEDALSVWPNIDVALRSTFSAERMFPIDATDVPTAMTALSSQWSAIREHAAIVLLSVHV